MEPDRSKRWIAGIIRVLLVVAGVAIVVAWVWHRVPRPSHLRVQVAPVPDSLGAGDLRIYNGDSTVDLVLQGSRILAGLSPRKVAEIRAKMDSERTSHAGGDTDLGSSIAQIVKSTVATAIGTHAVFPLAGIRDVRYDAGRVVVEGTDGRERPLFEGVKLDGGRPDAFRREDVERFRAAVQARKQQLGQS